MARYGRKGGREREGGRHIPTDTKSIPYVPSQVPPHFPHSTQLTHHPRITKFTFHIKLGTFLGPLLPSTTHDARRQANKPKPKPKPKPSCRLPSWHMLTSCLSPYLTYATQSAATHHHPNSPLPRTAATKQSKAKQNRTKQSIILRRVRARKIKTAGLPMEREPGADGTSRMAWHGIRTYFVPGEKCRGRGGLKAYGLRL